MHSTSRFAWFLEMKKARIAPMMLGFLKPNVVEAPPFVERRFLTLSVIDDEHKGDLSAETHVHDVSSSILDLEV